VPAGTPGLGERGGDARRIVRGPTPYLSGDHLEQLTVNTPLEVGAAQQVAHVPGSVGRRPQQRTQTQGLDIGTRIIEQVPDLDRLPCVDLMCRVLIGVLRAHPRLPRLPWSTSARAKVADQVVLPCPWLVRSLLAHTDRLGVRARGRYAASPDIVLSPSTGAG